MRDSVALLAHEIVAHVLREHALLRVRHRVQPRRTQVARLRVRKIIRFLLSQLLPFLREGRTGHRRTIQRAVRRLDDFHRRHVEGTLCLTSEERRFLLTDLDVKLLIDLSFGSGGAPPFVNVRILRRRQVASGDELINFPPFLRCKALR